MTPAAARQVHINPVYGSYFADPFIWKHRDTYYAIGTGAAEAEGRALGKVFPVLQSPDFYTWKFASNALAPPDPQFGSTFWAPAIAWANGLFYLYYSVGRGDLGHQLRVATSPDPQGPYHDCGLTLLDPDACPFAIDPHPFQDEDGQWYLLYARDYLEASAAGRAGTALAVAPLKTMTSLAGEERGVLRARFDWQRFERDRPRYGAVWDWHTLEGPCLWRHNGLYYCFFSGGRWENDTYGVDYAVAKHPLGPYSDAGGEPGPRVLKTVPRAVIGPGHNTIITGPEGGDYIVYHAWDRGMKARRLFIDKLVWTAAGPRCEGPTWGAEQISRA